MEKLANKVLVLGIDGLDPKLVKKYMDEGRMPHFKEFLEKGAANQEYKMIGGHPTVTPPMWTTLSTGASPYVHGVYDFFRKGERIGDACYNFDSRNSMAEPLWNKTVEAGLKTLVWHWPGSSWPPTSNNPLLSVVDGTQPEGVNCGVAGVDSEHLIVASDKTPELIFRRKAASDSNVPCFIEGMEIEDNTTESMMEMVAVTTGAIRGVMTPEYITPGLSETPLDVVMSPIKPADKWHFEIPADAKEFTILNSSGLIHRPALILKNEAGIYDKVVIYKNKKDATPITVLEKNIFKGDVIDEAFKGEEKIMTNRNMRVLELAEDGSTLRMWISTAMDFSNDTLWQPKTLLQDVLDNVGYPQPCCVSGGHDKRLIADCMGANWDYAGEWNANVLKYMAREKEFDVIFSHFHNVDLQGHMLVAYLKKGSKLSPETCQELFAEVYEQTDRYLERVMPLLDEGWTILIVSDHGQVCPEHDYNALSITPFMDGMIMPKLGYTVLKKDENGKDLPEIDWSKTKAVSWRMGEIWINLKGREPEGIVDSADKYDLEEQIITDLYSMRDEKTGYRNVLLALRNKDAVILGMGGPNAADILFFNAEGYNTDHADSISTMEGFADTSVMSTFIAAGPGIKTNCLTPRIIKHVDVAPTIAVLLGVEMPAQCEGAPIYQILEASKYGQ